MAQPQVVVYESSVFGFHPGSISEEEGWPLGSQLLQPLNVRVTTGFVSFSSTTSPTWSVSDSSSDLDTQSTGSFFPDKSIITLGSLIGGSSILELSRKSSRGKKKIHEPAAKEKKGKGCSRSKPWLFSLCAKAKAPAHHQRLNNISISGASRSAPSLAHFLALERRSYWMQKKSKPNSGLCPQ